jgi:hypothetical protein
LKAGGHLRKHSAHASSPSLRSCARCGVTKKTGRRTPSGSACSASKHPANTTKRTGSEARSDTRTQILFLNSGSKTGADRACDKRASQQAAAKQTCTGGARTE